MKKILFALSLLICSVSFGQNNHLPMAFTPIGSDLRFKYDSSLFTGSIYTRRLQLFGTSNNNLTFLNNDQSLKIIGNIMYLGDTSNGTGAPTFIEMGGYASAGRARMMIGWLGTHEFNYGYNLNYRGSPGHQYYDTAQDILYSYLGPDNGFGFQAVGKGHSNFLPDHVTGQDVYNAYGKNLSGFRWMAKTGNDFTGGELYTNQISIYDRTTTNREQDSGRRALFAVASSNLTYSGLPNWTFQDSVTVAIGGTGSATIPLTITGNSVGAKSIYLLNHSATTTNTNAIEFRKDVGGGTPFNVGTGTKNGIIGINGGVAEEGYISTSSAPGNFSNFDKYWKTTNIAGSFAERMRLGQEGHLLINTTTDNSFLTVNGSIAMAYRAISALRTLDATDCIIEVTSNSFTVTLPTAVGIAGRKYLIFNTGAGTVTLATTSSQTINGTTPGTIATTAHLTIYSNGANWLAF